MAGCTIRSITVKPSHRGRGYSWGLEYPLVYGNLHDAGGWAVWDRRTGVVTAFFPHVPNQHGWSDAEQQAARASQPADYRFNPFTLDMVP